MSVQQHERSWMSLPMAYIKFLRIFPRYSRKQTWGLHVQRADGKCCGGRYKNGITKRLQDRLAGESMTSKGYVYLSEISGYHISRLWHEQISQDEAVANVTLRLFGDSAMMDGRCDRTHPTHFEKTISDSARFILQSSKCVSLRQFSEPTFSARPSPVLVRRPSSS